MKFNEKLIQLRKKAGLSQEELGYKLNVTRQTVSKWELNQTTPEMDKLVEISKIFNITVDELINESEIQTDPNPIIEDKPIGNESTREKNVKIIVIGALIIVIVLIIGKCIIGFGAFNKITNTQGNIFDRIFDIFNKTTDNITDNLNESTDNVNATQEELFNQASDIINQSIDNTQNTTNQSTENSSKTEEIISQFEISNFNNSLEIYSGTKAGIHVTAALDNIITSNKTKNRKITVKYAETETQNEEEIRKVKQTIDTFSNYEVIFEYDTDGFINKIIIEKM